MKYISHHKCTIGLQRTRKIAIRTKWMSVLALGLVCIVLPEMRTDERTLLFAVVCASTQIVLYIGFNRAIISQEDLSIELFDGGFEHNFARNGTHIFVDDHRTQVKFEELKKVTILESGGDNVNAIHLVFRNDHKVIVGGFEDMKSIAAHIERGATHLSSVRCRRSDMSSRALVFAIASCVFVGVLLTVGLLGGDPRTPTLVAMAVGALAFLCKLSPDWTKLNKR